MGDRLPPTASHVAPSPLPLTQSTDNQATTATGSVLFALLVRYCSDQSAPLSLPRMQVPFLPPPSLCRLDRETSGVSARAILPEPEGGDLLLHETRATHNPCAAFPGGSNGSGEGGGAAKERQRGTEIKIKREIRIAALEKIRGPRHYQKIDK